MKRARSRPPRRRPGRGLTYTIFVIALAAAVLLFRSRRPPATGRAAIEDVADHAMLDSLYAADARQDWVRTLVWAERLGARRPFDHGVLLARGTAWRNYAVSQGLGRVRPRPALRTSLERMACTRRAIELMDSSSIAASTTARWLDSGQRLADLYQTLGLPGDALVAYETIKERLPNEMPPAMRAYWLRAVFYDPVHPDTSEWNRHMLSQERR